jgi:23S rRNA pseudouridine1911/1915/1917 synthase
VSTKPTTPSSDDDDELDDELAHVDAFTLPPGADPTIDWGLTSHLHPDGSPRIIERYLEVPPELAGLRLDHFIKTQIARLSRTRIQQVIETQLSRVTGTGSLKASTKVAEGDRFVIRRPAKPEPPCPRTFTVVHEDPRFLVIDKPALLPVHASAKFYFNTLTRVLGERFPDEPELQIAHRLDRETSGCLVVARDREAAVVIKQAFATKDKVIKEYLALVHGQPPWEREYLIDVPLRLALPGDPTRLPHVRMLPGPGGLPSRTRVKVEERRADTALVRCILETGRQHQIRAHLAAAGFPIVGDKLYTHGDDAFIRFCDEGLVPELAQLFGMPRHALHAARVTFPHPSTGARVTAEAPLPRDMRASA